MPAEFLAATFYPQRDQKLKVGRAVYALACNHHGGVLMDGVLMRPNDQEFIYVQGNGDFLKLGQRESWRLRRVD